MAAEKKTPKVSPPPTVAGGEPIGEWARIRAEAAAKGKFVGTFPIVEGLVLKPPTPERARKMARASLAVQAAIAASLNAMNNGCSREEVQDIQNRLEEADEAYTRALIGDSDYDAVQAYFADKEQDELKVFYAAIKHKFLREPTDEEMSRIEQLEEQNTRLIAVVRRLDPENTVVAEIVGERPGKGPASLTTSNTTGTTSNPTSPDTSVSAPETGASTTPDPGQSSSTTRKLLLA